jgi:hypothetical protein
MEYVVDTKVEMTNVRNNIKVLFEITLRTEENESKFDAMFLYPQYKDRLDSALTSMFNLYKNSDIGYHSLNAYLSQHERVLKQLATLVFLSNEREITGSDGEFRRLLWHIDSLNELAQNLS